MPKKQKKASSSKSIDGETKLFAFLAAFLTIIGFIIALLVKRDNDYVMFYAKQGLVLFIIQVIAWAVVMLPLMGWIAAPLIWIIFFVVWIIAWINALSGEKKNTLLIGEFAEKITI